MKNQCNYLTETQFNELLKVLQIFDEFLAEIVGTWKIFQVDFKLK